MGSLNCSEFSEGKLCLFILSSGRVFCDGKQTGFTASDHSNGVAVLIKAISFFKVWSLYSGWSYCAQNFECLMKYCSIWLIWYESSYDMGHFKWQNDRLIKKKLDAHSYKSFSSMNLIVRFRASFWTFLNIGKLPYDLGIDGQILGGNITTVIRKRAWTIFSTKMPSGHI